MTNKLTRMCLAFLLLSICVIRPAQAEDASPPTPPPVGEPMPSLDEGPDLPAPSISEGDAKPAAKATPAKPNMQEDLTVNEAPAPKSSGNAEGDNFYLPPPMENNTAPVPSGREPVYSVMGTERAEANLTGMEYKPGFSLNLGQGFRNFKPNINYRPADADPNTLNGIDHVLAWSVEARFYNWKNFFAVWGQVGMYSGYDKNYRLGILGEFSLGRKIQLLAGYVMNQNYVWWPGPANDSVTYRYSSNLLGVGAQYEAIVGPHYSVGVRGYIEKDLYMITMALSLEPAPHEAHANLNYKDSVW